MNARLMVFAAAMLAAGAVQAQDTGAVGGNFGKFYAGVAAGMVMPEDVSFSANATQGGASASASGKFEFDNGHSVSAFAGYRFSDYVRGEAELGYTAFDYDKITGTLTVTSGSTTANVSGSAEIEGDVSAVVGMLRGIVTPLGKSKVTPFVGLGVGFVSVEESITRIGTTSLNAKADSTDLAVDGTVGIEFAVSDKVDLGARYRYLWADTGSSGVDDFTAHNIMATAAFRF